MQPHKSGANMKTSTEKKGKIMPCLDSPRLLNTAFYNLACSKVQTLYCGPAFTIHQLQIVESHKLPQPSFLPVCVLQPPHNPRIQTTSQLLQSSFQQSTI
jgi:hypothetical protein